MPYSPTLNIGGVTCAIFLQDGITESWPANSGATANVTFKCFWQDRYRLVQALRGYVNLFAASFAYVIPFQYPTSPNLFCTGIGEIKGIGPRTDADGWLQYKFAIIPAEFSVPQYQIDPFQEGTPDPSGELYTTTTFKVSSEVFSPPGGSYYYIGGANNGQPVEESHLGFIRPRAEINMTRRKMPFVPLAAIMSIEGGGVNDAPVTFADKTFPTGSVLFTGMDVPEPVPDPTLGILLWDITFSFLANGSLDWNYFMDRKGVFTLINSKADGSGTPPFAYVDFNDLFGLSFGSGD